MTAPCPIAAPFSIKIGRSRAPPPNSTPSLLSMPLSVLSTVLSHRQRPELEFLCRKTCMYMKNMRDMSYTLASDGTNILLCSSTRRLFLSGFNVGRQCGLGSTEPFVRTPSWVRLPPVIRVHASHEAVFAFTTNGIWAWGKNTHGRLGVGTVNPVVARPMKVQVAGTVVKLTVAPHAVFFRTLAGWFASGSNNHGALAICGNRKSFVVPQEIPDSADILEIWSGHQSTFAQRPETLSACGCNLFGCLGICLGVSSVDVLTPVALPEGMRVTSVVSSDYSSFILVGTRCFVCGSNPDGQLALPPCPFLSSPKPLPFPVDGVITRGHATVFASNGRIVVAGNNKSKQFPSDQPVLPGPLKLGVPFTVAKVTLGPGSLFLQSDGGAWFARGDNSNAQLGVGELEASIGHLGPVHRGSLLHVCPGTSVSFFIGNDGVYVSGNINSAGDSSGNESFFGDDLLRDRTVPQRVWDGAKCRLLELAPTLVVKKAVARAGRDHRG